MKIRIAPKKNNTGATFTLFVGNTNPPKKEKAPEPVVESISSEETSEESNSSFEECESLVVKFSYLCDIDRIDRYVLFSLNKNTNEIANLQSRIIECENAIENACSVARIRSYESQISDFRKQIKLLSDIKTVARYSKEVDLILAEYRTLPTTESTSFMLAKRDSNRNNNDKRREELLENYLSIAKKYAEIRVERKETKIEEIKEYYCSSCFEKISENNFDYRGYLVCNHCENGNRVSKPIVASNKDYDVLNNLIKSVKRDACMQHIPFDIDRLLKKLDKYFLSIGKPTRDYYEKIPCNLYGRKEGTDQNDVIAAMKKLGYNKHYKDYFIVCHRYYGWEIPPVIRLLPKICEHFRATQKVWNEDINDEDKGCSSSLSVEFRKFKHYQILGLPCKAEHFNISKKIETVKECDRKWKEMCKLANHPEIRFIPT